MDTLDLDNFYLDNVTVAMKRCRRERERLGLVLDFVERGRRNECTSLYRLRALNFNAVIRRADVAILKVELKVEVRKWKLNKLEKSSFLEQHLGLSFQQP